MSGFHDISLSACFDVNAVLGLRRRFQVLPFDSGQDPVVHSDQRSSRSYDLSISSQTAREQMRVAAFFECRYGRFYSFRFRDWMDQSSGPVESAFSFSDQVIGTGDGINTVFYLSKSYDTADGAYNRLIQYVRGSNVAIGVNGSAATDVVVTDSGVVVFSGPPSVGATITAGFLFDTVVRFDTDTLTYSLDKGMKIRYDDIPLKEVLRPIFRKRGRAYDAWLASLGGTFTRTQLLAYMLSRGFHTRVVTL